MDKHPTRRIRDAADQTYMAFVMPKSPPRRKLLADVRDREYTELAKSARRGFWEDHDD